jgi:hypothetical protein
MCALPLERMNLIAVLGELLNERVMMTLHIRFFSLMWPRPAIEKDGLSDDATLLPYKRSPVSKVRRYSRIAFAASATETILTPGSEDHAPNNASTLWATKQLMPLSPQLI